jgi:hypothetical protein
MHTNDGSCPIGLNKLYVHLAWLQPLYACWENCFWWWFGGNDMFCGFSLWQHLTLYNVQKCLRKKLLIVLATHDGSGTVEFGYGH